MPVITHHSLLSPTAVHGVKRSPPTTLGLGKITFDNSEKLLYIRCSDY